MSEPRPRRWRIWARLVLTAMGCMLIAVLSALLLLPHALGRLAVDAAARHGFPDAGVEVLRVGLRGAVLGPLRASSAEGALSAESVRIGYSPALLAAGRADTVELAGVACTLRHAEGRWTLVGLEHLVDDAPGGARAFSIPLLPVRQVRLTNGQLRICRGPLEVLVPFAATVHVDAQTAIEAEFRTLPTGTVRLRARLSTDLREIEATVSGHGLAASDLRQWAAIAGVTLPEDLHVDGGTLRFTLDAQGGQGRFPSGSLRAWADDGRGRFRGIPVDGVRIGLQGSFPAASGPAPQVTGEIRAAAPGADLRLHLNADLNTGSGAAELAEGTFDLHDLSIALTPLGIGRLPEDPQGQAALSGHVRFAAWRLAGAELNAHADEVSLRTRHGVCRGREIAAEVTYPGGGGATRFSARGYAALPEVADLTVSAFPFMVAGTLESCTVEAGPVTVGRGRVAAEIRAAAVIATADAADLPPTLDLRVEVTAIEMDDRKIAAGSASFRGSVDGSGSFTFDLARQADAALPGAHLAGSGSSSRRPDGMRIAAETRARLAPGAAPVPLAGGTLQARDLDAAVDFRWDDPTRWSVRAALNGTGLDYSRPDGGAAGDLKASIALGQDPAGAKASLDLTGANLAIRTASWRAASSELRLGLQAAPPPGALLLDRAPAGVEALRRRALDWFPRLEGQAAAQGVSLSLPGSFEVEGGSFQLPFAVAPAGCPSDWRLLATPEPGRLAVTSVAAGARQVTDLQADLAWLPNAHLQLRGSAGVPLLGTRIGLSGTCAPWPAPAAEVTANLPETVVGDGRLWARLAPVPAGLQLTGTVSGWTRLGYANGRLDGAAALDLSRGELRLSEPEISMSGVRLQARFPSLTPLRTAPHQRLSFDSAVIGGMPLVGGNVVWQLEEGGLLFLEQAAVGWCGGTLRAFSVPLSLDRPEVDMVVYAEDVELVRVFSLLQGFKGSGQGRLYGRLPLSYRNGVFAYERGFLYSVPTEVGRLQVADASFLTRGVPPSDPSYGRLKLAEEALSDFSYSTVALEFAGRGGGDTRLRLRIVGEGGSRRRQPLDLTVNINGELEQYLNMGLRMLGTLP